MSDQPGEAILAPVIVEGWRVGVSATLQHHSLPLTHCDVTGAVMSVESQIGHWTKQDADLPLVLQGLLRYVLVVSPAADKGGIMGRCWFKVCNCCEYLPVRALRLPDNLQRLASDPKRGVRRRIGSKHLTSHIIALS